MYLNSNSIITYYSSHKLKDSRPFFWSLVCYIILSCCADWISFSWASKSSDLVIPSYSFSLTSISSFHAISLNDFVWDWTTAIMPSISTQHSIGMAWIPPPRGKLKLNFDGLAIGNPGLTGFGGIIRDENGQVVLAMCGPLGEEDSTKAELLSLLYGLREVERLEWHGCLVEGGSKVVSPGHLVYVRGIGCGSILFMRSGILWEWVLCFLTFQELKMGKLTVLQSGGESSLKCSRAIGFRLGIEMMKYREDSIVLFVVFLYPLLFFLFFLIKLWLFIKNKKLVYQISSLLEGLPFHIPSACNR